MAVWMENWWDGKEGRAKAGALSFKLPDTRGKLLRISRRSHDMCSGLRVFWYATDESLKLRGMRACCAVRLCTSTRRGTGWRRRGCAASRQSFVHSLSLSLSAANALGPARTRPRTRECSPRLAAL